MDDFSKFIMGFFIVFIGIPLTLLCGVIIYSVVSSYYLVWIS